MATATKPRLLSEVYPRVRRKLAKKLSETTLWGYDEAVRRLDRFRRDISIAELSQALVLEFKAWLRSNGYSAATIEASVGSIRIVIRSIDPSRCPRERRKSLAAEIGSGSLRELFEDVYWPHKTRGNSANNLRLYRNALANFETYLSRSATLADLTDDNIRELMAWLVVRGRSKETANKVSRHLLALWRYAAKRRIVEVFPTVDQLQTVLRIPKAWTREELASLFKTARNLKGRVGEFPAADWWHALLLTIWYTGERIGAALGLEWSDFDAKSGWIVARAEVRKGGKKDKAYYLPYNARQAIEKLRGIDGAIFVWPLGATTIFGRFKQLLKAANLPTDRMSKFHRIRRSTASHLKAAGGDPTEAMDHANGMTTKRHYLDPRICSTGTAADLLFDPEAIGGAQ